MPLFRKSKSGDSGRPSIRDGACIYNGEPFPERGERIIIAGIEMDVLLDRSDVPERWTDLAEAIRLHTGEARERRVFANILGTLLAMVENKLGPLGQALDSNSQAEAAGLALRRGANAITDTRGAFAAHPQGLEIFDFEVIKIASLLASPQGMQSRADAGWPHPDIWSGDVNAFPYPY